jgi:hypothetical protein
MDTYINSMILDFKAKVQVGIQGNSYELLGKAFATFLYNKNTWTDLVAESSSGSLASPTSSFFRAGSIPNISFITDENNYYYTASVSENRNDIPAFMGAAIPGSSNTDSRRGIRDYADSYFTTLLTAGQSLGYSIVALLKQSTSLDFASNIGALPQLIGRGSGRSDIDGDAASYAALYNVVTQALIERANGFNLTHEPLAPLTSNLSAKIVKANGSIQNLTLNTQYTISSQLIMLDQAVLDSCEVGDQLVVDYNY